MAYNLSALKQNLGAPVAITFFCCLFSYVVTAQSRVKGRVLNTNGEPLANASVVLLKSGDSSLIKVLSSIQKGRKDSFIMIFFTASNE